MLMVGVWRVHGPTGLVLVPIHICGWGKDRSKLFLHKLTLREDGLSNQVVAQGPEGPGKSTVH